MSDLVAGRYPTTYDEWMYDGQPYPPYRESMPRAAISSGTAGVSTSATSGKMYVTAVACYPGDIFNYVTVYCASLNSGTSTHAFAAVYQGTGIKGGMQAAATLTCQSTDAVFTAAAQKLKLGSTVVIGGTPGTAQGPSTAALSPSGPQILGVALMLAWTSDAPTVDGSLGGSPTTIGTGLVSQIPRCLIAGSSLTTTAPGTLTGATATGTGVIPYIVLSQY